MTEQYYTASENGDELFYMEIPTIHEAKRTTLRRTSNTLENLRQQQPERESTPFNAYESDEEAASPTESDDVDLSSVADSASTHSDDSSTEWELDEAKPVRLVLAGAARMISIHKPSRKRLAIDTSLTDMSTSYQSIESNTDQFAHRSHSRKSSSSSNADSTTSTPPSSVPSSPEAAPAEHFPKHVRSVPVTQAANRRLSHISFQQKSLKTQERTPSPPNSSVNTRKLRKKTKFSSPISIARLNKDSKRKSASYEDDDMDIYDALTDSKISSQLTQTTTPSKPKMIPRGAAERAPPPKLPPCPSNYSNDDAVISCQRAKDLAAWHRTGRPTTVQQ